MTTPQSNIDDTGGDLLERARGDADVYAAAIGRVRALIGPWRVMAPADLAAAAGQAEAIIAAADAVADERLQAAIAAARASHGGR